MASKRRLHSGGERYPAMATRIAPSSVRHREPSFHFTISESSGKKTTKSMKGKPEGEGIPKTGERAKAAKNRGVSLKRPQECQNVEGPSGNA